MSKKSTKQEEPPSPPEALQEDEGSLAEMLEEAIAQRLTQAISKRCTKLCITRYLTDKLDVAEVNCLRNCADKMSEAQGVTESTLDEWGRTN